MISLCYHAVSRTWPAALSVTPEALEQQLGHLARRGYRGATFTEAVLRGDRKTLAVTFDDAYRSVIELALPILEAFGMPATVFVPTRFVGTEQPMSWPGIEGWIDGPHERELVPMSADELHTLQTAGWEIGSHTVTHPRLTYLEDADLTRELTDSRRQCEELMEAPCTSLAYPYGDHDARVVAAAEQAGYEAAATLPGPLHPPAPLRAPRLGVYHDDDILRFRVKASPLVAAVRASTPVRRLEARIRG